MELERGLRRCWEGVLADASSVTSVLLSRHYSIIFPSAIITDTPPRIQCKSFPHIDPCPFAPPSQSFALLMFLLLNTGLDPIPTLCRHHPLERLSFVLPLRSLTSQYGIFASSPFSYQSNDLPRDSSMDRRTHVDWIQSLGQSGCS